MLRIALAVLALLTIPAPALAAEGFVGVLENGRLVRFTDQTRFTIPLSRPVALRGMLPGERIVALGLAQRGLVGVGSSARLYLINRGSGSALPIGPPFPQGLRGSRFSLAAAPNTNQGRLVSDVGQDLAIDLLTGATAAGPGLRRAQDGAPIRPAVDAATDGALIGAQLGPPTLFRETAPGASTMTAVPVERRERDPVISLPIGFQLGSNGRGYLLAVLGDRQRRRQSVLLTVDPETGKQVQRSGRSVYQQFGRRITTFASVGQAPDDTTPPIASIRTRPHLSVRGLLHHVFPARVACAEACYAFVSVNVAGRRLATLFATRDTPGTVRFPTFWVSSRNRMLLLRSVGRRARIEFEITDYNGNRRTFARTVRLVR